jgi:regulator of protease activity HflC (stomatin/prohibitin superfamily)
VATAGPALESEPKIIRELSVSDVQKDGIMPNTSASTIAAQNGLTLKIFRQEIVVWEYERGLLYHDGRFLRILMPGRYQFWRWQKIRVVKVSTRQMSEVITGQEILTADKVEVRVSLIAQYAVTDPVVAINSVESFTDQLYQDLQLTLRESVASRTVDQLLEAREEISTGLLAQVAPLALNYGVTLHRIGIRDIVLPGVVRNVFLKEIEADRVGRADLIKARHEVAAARARSNTARILAENPNVARMQEIDALVNLAGKSGNVVLLPNLADMFVPRDATTATSTSNGSTTEE